MPCYQTGSREGDLEESLGEVSKERNKLDAMLCAVFDVLEKEGTLEKVIAAVDIQECGVARVAFTKWWRRHKASDAARKEREKAEADEAELRKRTLANLTPAQRRALRLT